MPKKISLNTLEDLAAWALEAADTSTDNARLVARALVAADADGLASHGVSRVPFYADQAACKKVDGRAEPVLEQPASAAIRVDARDGFAYPAIRLGLERAIQVAPRSGVAAVTITNSHHCGAVGYHIEGVAEQGLLTLGFTNSPAGIAPWGGSRGTFGTNPIAFACPRREHPPLVADLSLSRVARGKVMLAQKRGEPIPEGWALDADGVATSDPEAGLAGTMVPIGEAKGAALALMVELLTAALAGANFAFEASSFFTAEGPPPRIAQSFVVLDPNAFCAADFGDRVETLIAEIASQPGARLPGAQRLQQRAEAHEHGVSIPADLLAELERRAGGEAGTPT